jgi:chitinase
MKSNLFFATIFTFICTLLNAQTPALVGYWHNWNAASSPYIPLDQVDARYNVVCVSFGVPQAGTNAQIVFVPDGATQATLITQIQTLKSQGRKVVLSLGGATAPISITNAADKTAFINSVTSLVNTYGFDGIDIDFEGSSLSVTSGSTIANPVDAPVVNLIAGLKQVMVNFRTTKNSKMFLSMAPETAFVQGGMSAYGGIWGGYLPVINALRDSMDILQVQLYNSGSMYGIDGKIYTQGTADFLVSQTEAVIKGFNTAGGAFAGLPASKIAVGLPACSSAAGSGFATTATVKAAVNYLRGTGPKPGTYTLSKVGGYPDLRGLMTWSINWDKVSTCGAAYEFAQNFQTIFSGVTNAYPSVSITSPTNNASFLMPASITINATAADTDGTIAKVEFYNGTTLLNSDNAAPYLFTWSGMAAGTYSLTAVAYDNLSAATTSTAVTVVVKAANTPPSVSITSPTNNATFSTPASVTINATATDADGTIAKVEFYNGTTLLNTDNAAPYSFVWTGMAAGTYSLTAKAYDNSGAITTSTAVTIVVKAANTAPSVSITSPTNNASFAFPATVTINATAADADGTITKVEFYSGTTLLNTDNTAPYSYTWANIAAKTYSITAKAYDNSGAVTTSTAVSFVVKKTNIAPSVSITSPTTNAQFNAPATVLITATAADADGTVSKVDFYKGTTLLGTSTVAPYTFSWANIAAGTYSLTAKATDNSGVATTSAAVSIVVNVATATDLIGPTCAGLNSVLVYEVSAANIVNITTTNWWSSGSVASIVPVVGQPWKATVSFGQWFLGGDVCVGVNYSAAPWYKQICKTVSLCPAIKQAIAPAAKSDLVMPNPSNSTFNFTAVRNVQNAKVYDALGLLKLDLGVMENAQTVNFGELLPSGIYFLRLDFADKTNEVVKLMKAQ